MNCNQLQYLRELIHAGSFTRAAQNLGISQPALSTQIRKLEEETGLLLVNRQARPLQLTDDGEPFYELALDILHRMDALKELPLELSAKVEGNIRIGMIPTLAPYLLALISDELEQRHPGLVLEVEELLTETIVRELRTGHLDAGLVSTPLRMKRLETKPLFYERFYLYMAETHPLGNREQVPIDQLDLRDLWYLREGNCFANQVNAICKLAGNQPSGTNLRYFSNSIESLRRIVERTDGATFLPELATMQVPSESEDLIKTISGTDPVREISLVYAPGYAKKRLVDAFTDALLSQLPSHMKQKPADWIVDTELEIP